MTHYLEASRGHFSASRPEKPHIKTRNKKTMPGHSLSSPHSLFTPRDPADTAPGGVLNRPASPIRARSECKGEKILVEEDEDT
ncbi:hypothetical protein E2C01_048460 [Portunus trituberculatus]|uniref:Uncharacterized protein n=1 Tax=Portunus trituberculatus TaxID=210409 RepID=A0A5B7GAA0_PORTR|nr:hypothetical protein [Portunus trituberculatus]